jgi:glycine/D-amino acid oxidase-like deaminating enzyme/nitrite reductase/ring-hydroxylating ferredoxin subunit
VLHIPVPSNRDFSTAGGIADCSTFVLKKAQVLSSPLDDGRNGGRERRIEARVVAAQWENAAVNVSSERSTSLWGKSAEAGNAPPLTADKTADVAIVGGGIAGLSTAYELTRAGQRVIVLDRGPIGGGMTARTTGHLASELDDYYHALIEKRGLDAARQVYQAQAAAVNRIEAVSRDEGIDCDFRRLDGYLFLAPNTDPSVLEKELEAAREVGLTAAWAETAPLPGRKSGRCLRFPDQGRFHPLKYLDGLIRCILRDGGRLHGETTVNDVAAQEDGSVLVKTDGGASVRARACAVTTNSPINEVEVHLKQVPYRTYAIAGRVPRGSVPDALYWDTLDPYHYVRLQPGEAGSDWLISGGEDHKSGEAADMEERFRRLEAWTRELFPSFVGAQHRWSGQVMEPVDYAALIGRSPTGENIYMATGDSGQGLTNSVAASLIISAMILGRQSSFAAAHDPQRKSVGAVQEFIGENITPLANLAEYVAGGDVSSVDELKPGEGAVVRQGLALVAAYRDEDGGLQLRSAKCTHAGCVVHWNPFERCWDCPCHGSHFAPDGTAINGPAVAPLEELES